MSQTKPGTLVDVAVVGGGPAGLTVAREAALRGLAVFLFHDEPLGGLVRCARRVGPGPCWDGDLAGECVADLLVGSLHSSRCGVVEGRVQALRHHSLGFELDIKTRIGSCQVREHSPGSDGTFPHQAGPDGLTTVESKCVVLATGTRPVPIPDLVVGSGLRSGIRVARDARELPRALSRTRVVVCGGGEAAVDTALLAADRGAYVTLVVRASGFRANDHLIAEAESRRLFDPAFSILFNHELLAVLPATGSHCASLVVGARVEPYPPVCGRGSIEAISTRLACDHLVVCFGRVPDLGLYRQVLADGPDPEQVETAVPGLFLAGDVLRTTSRYVALAIEDAVRCVEMIQKHINNSK